MSLKEMALTTVTMGVIQNYLYNTPCAYFVVTVIDIFVDDILYIPVSELFTLP